MGDISIIARRLSDGHVQYGWSGNGGYFDMVGARLLKWYQNPKDVEYLFELGQTRLIGQVGSEKGGFSYFESHDPIGEAFWTGRTERMIFSKIAFVDYGYFFDIDNKWYYIIPGPFRVKIPLELIANNLNDRSYEFDYLERIQERIVKFIFQEYKSSHPDFEKFLKKNGYDAEIVQEKLSNRGAYSFYDLCDKYQDIYKYFDDWILVKANSDYTDIQEIIMQKKSVVHVETCMW